MKHFANSYELRQESDKSQSETENTFICSDFYPSFLDFSAVLTEILLATVEFNCGQYDFIFVIVRSKDIARKKKMASLIEMAKNDNNFLMLCWLFDEEIESEFGLFVGVYLEEFRREDTELTQLMEEVLLYTHWKKFGILDRQQHDLREKRLRATLVLFEVPRVAVGAKQYSEMGCTFP